MSAAEVEIVEGHAVEEVDVDVEPGAMIPYTPQPVNLFGAASLLRRWRKPRSTRTRSRT